MCFGMEELTQNPVMGSTLLIVVTASRLGTQAINSDLSTIHAEWIQIHTYTENLAKSVKVCTSIY